MFEFYARQAGLEDAEAAARKASLEFPPSDEELAKRWAAELDRHGVRRAHLLGSAPGEQAAICRAVAACPGRFVPFQMVNPKSPPIPRLEDLRGLLLFPAMHGYYPDECRPTYQAARARGLVVFVHLGRLRIALREKLGIQGQPDERFGDPVRFATVVREFPDVRFVVPHFGCGTLKTLIGATRGVRNLYLDTSSSNEWIKTRPDFSDLQSVFRAALDAPQFGPERLLFGSDSTVFPRGWRKDVFEAQRAAMTELKLSENETRAILDRNAERLLQ